MKIEATALLEEMKQRVLLDVRSLGEYESGHVPGAVHFPLFSNEERAIVGKLYKQESKEAAFLKGLEIVGPKMADFVREAKKLAPEKQLLVHCWRGGDRSGSMAWLLRKAGFDVQVLTGGYKAYRRMVLDGFEQTILPLLVLGGLTGSGKTEILNALADQGEQIIDLEKLAHHKGSAFGTIGESPQPRVEQFENDLHHAIQQLDLNRRIWVENESQSIGRVYIPKGMWIQKKQAPILNIEISMDCRLDILLEMYTDCDPALLEDAFQRIQKRLGGQHLKAALEALRVKDYRTAATIALKYYDKSYNFALTRNKQQPIASFQSDTHEPEKMAARLIQFCEKTETIDALYNLKA